MATQATNWLETVESYAPVHHPRSPTAQKENTELRAHPSVQVKTKTYGESTAGMQAVMTEESYRSP